MEACRSFESVSAMSSSEVGEDLNIKQTQQMQLVGFGKRYDEQGHGEGGVKAE